MESSGTQIAIQGTSARVSGAAESHRKSANMAGRVKPHYSAHAKRRSGKRRTAQTYCYIALHL
eukprot:14631442-Heterocapsa_arctica.AAC.1